MGHGREPSAANIAEFTTIHFNPNELDALIRLHGARGEYRKATVCPCARVETGMGAAGCTACNGLGWAYPADARGECKFLDSSRSGSNKNQPSGYIISGTINVTVQSGLIPAIGDILLPCGERHVVHESLHRALDQVDQRAVAETADFGQRRLRGGPRAERLLYRDHVAIEHVSFLVKGELRTAREGADFRLVPDGQGSRIDWVSGRGPARGEGYSVRYTADGAYMVKSTMPVLRREAGRQMPYRTVMDRLDKRAEADLR